MAEASVQQVQFMQNLLKQQGLYKGAIDGNSENPQYVTALEQYQQNNKLVVSGRLDDQTLAPLNQFFAGLSGGGGVTPLEQLAIVAKYGQAMAPFIFHPELGPIIVNAQRNGVALDQLRLMISNTQYWKQTNETMRNWETLKVVDPAAAGRQLDQSLSVVRDTLAKYGIDWLGEADLRRLANDRIAFNWAENDDAMFNDIVEKLLNQSPRRDTELVGSVGQIMGQLKANAASQLLTIDNGTAYNYASRIVGGESTLEAYNVAFRQQAKVKAPWAAELIDNGVLLSDLFDQHRQRIATQLEIDPESVDFVNDPRWRSVVNFADPKSGQTRAMTETEAEILARQQPEWSATAGANDQASQLTDTLSTTWGVRGRA